MTFDAPMVDYAPYLLAGLGTLCGAFSCLGLRRPLATLLLRLAFGGLCGFFVLLLPYLALRQMGAYQLHCSQGYFEIEFGDRAEWIPGAGWLWMATRPFQVIDAALCGRFLPAPSGG
jgi:hypothetical protein